MSRAVSFLRKQLLLLIVVVLSIPSFFALFHQGFFHPHDAIFVARIFAMAQGLRDSQIPVRWVSEFRFGEPLYNFYAPLPYYLGALFSFVGFSYIDSSKLLLGLGIILSGIAMYLLASKLFGRFAGLVSAVFYIYAPYHSVDIYVRGALSESWSLVFFPLIFLAIYNLSKERRINQFIFLTLSLVGLFLTHSIMTLLFAPFIVGWIILLFLLKREIKFLYWVLGALGLAFGIAAYFLLPAFFERNLVQSSKLTTGYFDYRGHFVALRQFVTPFWGYGASLWGPVDDLSLQIGLVHWGGVVVSLLLAFLGIFKLKKLAFLKTNKLVSIVVIFLGLEFLFSLFMMHNKSQYIWDIFPILSFTQFPWRFL